MFNIPSLSETPEAASKVRNLRSIHPSQSRSNAMFHDISAYFRPTDKCQTCKKQKCKRSIHDARLRRIPALERKNQAEGPFSVKIAPF